MELPANLVRAVAMNDDHGTIAAAKEYLETNPSSVEALQHLVAAAIRIQDARTAIQAATAWTVTAPDSAEAWYSLGLAHALGEDPLAAMSAHQEAIKRDPQHVGALINVAGYFSRAGYLREAVTAFQSAVTLAPTNIAGLNNFASCLKDAGLLGNAINMYERALSVNPCLSDTHSNLCYLTQFIPGVTLAKLRDVHAQWQQRYEEPYVDLRLPHSNDRDKERVLRVGFISEDFRQHTVGHYLLPVLEALPRGRLHVICYSLKEVTDAINARFRACADEYHDVRCLSVDALAGKIHDDRIDVLFDLSGHTSGSRLPVFARKPAPVQISWLGYVGTTGLKAIDYVIGSTTNMPEGVEAFYSERILRFPAGMSHQCYTPLFGDTPVGPSPSDLNGYVTFGSFGGPVKVNPLVISAWAAILRTVPDSRLLLKGAGYHSAYTQDRLRTAFQSHGVEQTDRILFEPFAPPPVGFEAYNRIDIVLDTWPFSGCTTTCEALWMGCPIVTLPQETAASRHTVSYLNALGMLDGVASDIPSYVQRAVQLARNYPRRRRLRETLRGQLLGSVVCDSARFAVELTRLIRQAWGEWCDSRE